MKLGREAAAEVQQQMPMLQRRSASTTTSSEIGARLVRNIPAEFQHNEFRYTFDVVNLREINAFALPGGPMYAHRGMIEKAGSEGGDRRRAGARDQPRRASPRHRAGHQGGQVPDGPDRQRDPRRHHRRPDGCSGIDQVGQFGFGTAFLKYSREYEKQADILGAQIMARAGYDPRAMASMFRTIEQEGGGARARVDEQPPEPGQPRRVHHAGSAGAARREPGAATRSEFQNVQARLRADVAGADDAKKSRAAAAAAIATARHADRAPRDRAARVEAPSTRYTTYNEGDVFRIGVPSNWREMPSETR